MDAAVCQIESPPACDVLIVLGALVGVDGHPGRVARLRMAHALTLHQAHYPACGLLISGGRRPGTPISEARAMAGWGTAWWAREQTGESSPAWEECFLYEEESLTTAASACHTAALLTARGWCRAGLITDDLHYRRALYLFRRVYREHGLVVEPLPPLPLKADYLSRRRYLRLGKFLLREAGAWVKLGWGEAWRRLGGTAP